MGHFLSPVRVFCKEQELGRQRLDMIVDRVQVVEVKATQHLSPIATRQLLNYSRATNLDAGLLHHFGGTASVFRLIATRSKGQIEPLLEALTAEQSSGGDGWQAYTRFCLGASALSVPISENRTTLHLDAASPTIFPEDPLQISQFGPEFVYHIRVA